MAVKIVTDSTADVPPALIRELGIEIVPLYLNFGDHAYREGIDITGDNFGRIVQEMGRQPTTTAPSTLAFDQTYRRLAHTHDGIISIHLSGQLSSAFKAAAQAREKLPPSLVRLEVVDTHSVSLGMGLTVIAAARMAKAGQPVDTIIREVQHRVQHTHMLCFADTMEYLERSGRLSLAANMVGSMSRIKPLLLLDQGHLVPYERTRTRAKAIDGLYTFVEDFPQVAEIGVVYGTTPEDADKLIEKVSALFPREQVLRAEYGPTIAVHLGPGAMAVVVYEGHEE